LILNWWGLNLVSYSVSYVNELHKIVNNSIKMFADDNKIWKKFRII